jgi:hypothetical protein
MTAKIRIAMKKGTFAIPAAEIASSCVSSHSGRISDRCHGTGRLGHGRLLILDRAPDSEVSMSTAILPDRTEAAEYYFTYINQVPAGDICEILARQAGDTLTLLRGISEERSLYRYAPDKWSVRQLLSHVNDTERVFVFRALWFARGFDTPLPSFDQDMAIWGAGADERAWSSHLDEFGAVRSATSSFFESLADDAWGRRGVASGNPFTVRALAYVTAGHVAHHMRVLRERYL